MRLLGPVPATTMVVTALLFAGCLANAPASPKASEAPQVAAATNMTRSVEIKYAGTVGAQVCPNGAMCFPVMAAPSSEDPHIVPIEGALKEVHLKITWSGTGPAAAASYTVVVTAQAKTNTTGGRGGGGAGGARGASGTELARKSGGSPLEVHIMDAKWNATDAQIRIQLLPVPRAPAPSSVETGTAFQVAGNYVSVVAMAPMAGMTAKNSTTPSASATVAPPR